MRYCDELDLLSASPVVIPDVCTINPVMLSNFRGRGGGERYKEYCHYLSLVATTTEDLVNWLVAVEVMKQPPKETVASISQFDLISSIPFLRELIQGSLSYFIEENLEWDKRKRVFKCCGTDGNVVGDINRTTYHTVCKVIMESNFIHADDEDESDMKFANAKSKSIFEKLRAGREKKRKAAPKGNAPKFTDMISAVSAKSNGYNLLNIWELSVYQLYDQFMRINNNYQLDIYGLKWAAWGTEPFDFSMWYQVQKNKEEN
jgi:hypothetical protein